MVGWMDASDENLQGWLQTGRALPWVAMETAVHVESSPLPRFDHAVRKCQVGKRVLPVT